MDNLYRSCTLTRFNDQLHSCYAVFEPEPEPEPEPAPPPEPEPPPAVDPMVPYRVESAMEIQCTNYSCR